MFHWKRQILFILGNGLLLILLSACGAFGGAAEDTTPATLGSDLLLSGEAVLSCNTTCSTRAQCGQDPSQQPVILVNSAGPAVDGHDRWITNDTTVVINTTQDRAVAKISTGEQYLLRFYQVTLPVDQTVVWVAGWCVQQ